MLESNKPKLYKPPTIWVFVALVGLNILLLVLIWPLSLEHYIYSNLLAKVKGDGSSERGLTFCPAPHDNETHILASFSTDVLGDCIEGTSSPKHYYGLGEDNQWINIYISVEKV